MGAAVDPRRRGPGATRSSRHSTCRRPSGAGVSRGSAPGSGTRPRRVVGRAARSARTGQYDAAVTATEDTAAGELRPLNPATLEPVGRVPVTSPAELEEAVGEARAAQAAWCRRSVSERARLLRDAIEALLDAADDVAARSSPKPESPASRRSRPRCSSRSRRLPGSSAARRASCARSDSVSRSGTWPTRGPGCSTSRWASSAIVSPWNFPFGIAFSQAATAVAAGNAAVVKPSELTPHAGRWVEEIFRRAGAPPGLSARFRAWGDRRRRARRASRRRPGRFTGSTAVGRRVGARAAERLVPAILELGGKDPMLVLDDADLDRAVAGALWERSPIAARCARASSGST